MTKKYSLLLLSIFIEYSLAAQSPQKGILFYFFDSTSHKSHSDKNDFQIFTDKDQYEFLKHANVEMDVAIAISNKDLRIVSIYGVGLLFPGLENGNKTNYGLYKKYEEHLEKYGYKVIKGTSDVVNPGVPGLQSVAYNYAKKYNKLLFQKLALK